MHLVSPLDLSLPHLRARLLTACRAIREHAVGNVGGAPKSTVGGGAPAAEASWRLWSALWLLHIQREAAGGSMSRNKTEVIF